MLILLIAIIFNVTPVDSLKDLGGTDAQHRLASEIAGAYYLDSLLVWSVIQSESAWDSLARSSKDCLGLMQLRPKFHGNLPDSMYYDQEFNLNAGCFYLGMLIDKFNGDVDKALTGYNYGPWHKVTRQIGTSAYARKILERVDKWRMVRKE